ncbi:hypothetical protein KDM41_08455 [bacterium]|nr:hypothetical protein [bacterium]
MSRTSAPPPPVPAGRLAVAACAAACLLGAVILALRLDEAPVGAATDDAYYVEMARSLAEGRGPVLSLGPGRMDERPGIFPAGFPLLLAPLAAAWPDSLGVFRAVPVLAALALVLLAWWWPPAGTPRPLRLALVAALAVNPWLLGWAGRILSDLPYAALALASLLAAARGLEGGRSRPLALAGVLAGAGIAVRTVGWAGVLAVGVVLVAERRTRDLLLFLAAALVVLVPIWLLTETSPLSAAYVAQVGGLGAETGGRFALGSALLYVVEWPVALVPVFGAPVRDAFVRAGVGIVYQLAALAVGVGLMVLVGRAAGRLWRTGPARVRARLAFFFLFFTMVALVNFRGYPTPVQTRLLLPVLPVGAWLVLAGSWDRRPLAALVVGAMVLGGLAHDGWRIARPLGATRNADGSGLVDPGAGAGLVRERTAPDAVVMCNDPLQRHIHLRRPVVDLPADPAGLDAAVARDGVAWLLLGPSVHDRPGRLEAPAAGCLATARAQPAVYVPAGADSVAAVWSFEIRR